MNLLKCLVPNNQTLKLTLNLFKIKSALTLLISIITKHYTWFSLRHYIERSKLCLICYLFYIFFVWILDSNSNWFQTGKEFCKYN